MALRTVLSLIPTAGILPGKIKLDEAFNFTGTLQKSGVDIDPNQNLTYARVKCATLADIPNLASGAPSVIDGYNLQQNDDVLAWMQDPATENGIYNDGTVGSGSNGVMTRATERDAAAELPQGMLVYVQNGAVHGGKLFKLTSAVVTIGSDAVTFEEQEEGLSPITATGEPAALADGDGSTLIFDLPYAGTVALTVYVDGIMQLPTTWSIGAGTGTGGVDELTFGAGNAPANGAKVEAQGLRRV